MPLFISHTAYLDKFWKEKKYPKEYFYDGFLGNLLPDIRYFTKQSREQTHSKDLMETILISPSTDPQRIKYFKKGFDFHLILDKWWQKQIYFPSDFEKFGLCLKFYDDILLAKKITQIDFFQDKDIKLVYDIDFLDLQKETVKKWYNFVFNYIKNITGDSSPDGIRKILQSSKLFNEELSKKIVEEIDKISQNNEIKNKLIEMFDDFQYYK